MGNLKRYTFQIAALSILTFIAFAGARTTVSEMRVVPTAGDLPQLRADAHQGHALELSQRGLASVSTVDLSRQVYSAVKANVPNKYKDRAFEIARAVINEANHHKMDPFFLLAVIKTESHFRIKARGRHGEIGLMQIMPQTAKWIASQAGLNPDLINLEDPATNIRIGATYFASLRRSFNGAPARYIGAYNMGPGNVRKLAMMNIEPQVYPGKVLRNYRGFYVTMAKNMIVFDSKIVEKSGKVSRKLESRVIPASKVRNLRLNTFAAWERV